MKAAIQRFWDETPCGVKNASSQLQAMAFHKEVEEYRYNLEYHIPLVCEFDEHQNERVLEVGCGIGTDGRQFADGGANYCGLDLSPRSVRLTQESFRLFNLTGDFVNSDAEQLPFQDESFDLIYSHGVLHHTPNTHQAIAEIHRVLNKSGKTIIMLYSRQSLHYWLGAMVVGRLRLASIRRRIGRHAFNKMVGLGADHHGRLPNNVVVNNSTDGVGNPLSKMYTRTEIQELFSDFRQVNVSRHFIPTNKIPIVGRYLPRLLVSWLGKLMGTSYYVKAFK
jgi:SAM-dependent methyltransferase